MSIKMATFKNKHGEVFKLGSNGITVMMAGDETDNEVISLFNPEFNIWSKEELYKLGKALMEMHHD